ncbi:selenide, water dikinase SelD [Pelagovum pacificum]|uniref:Selenide, water dikinase SelD n=1 Tax=Pelagovum pacificum TaxID=2588711 RepID=A0A5C5GJ69_9RHOB|nr:selenide, water dikinase SelD [Pelagovum pacificum]QQA42946.1 selenide, water dikinase SelD [Pelagovum pacificum]TNY33911.1 selenide, water dikinase SelD [Pelagovum pacificum]
MRADVPLTRDLVLIGGGHTHALVLRKWGMQPLPGVRLTLIDPNPAAAYSGMLPGMVAGHYEPDELQIDLGRLARFAGARLVTGAVDGIDPDARTVHVPGRPAIAYDICSVDVGITSGMPDLPGFDRFAVPAKPLAAFADRWTAFRAGTSQPRVAVIGGGVAGAELSMAMAHALRDRDASVTLIDRGEALDGFTDDVRDRLMAAVTATGVTVRENVDVSEVEEGALLTSEGRIEADLIVGAAGARPPAWLTQTGLDLHDGFIAVDSRLRSSVPEVFAAGDCAHLSHAPRPKAGVFAVREAPVLYDNLRAALSGGRLRVYRPQKDYLKLISLGGRSAAAEKRGRLFAGPLMWRWKDWIDRRFMRKFADLPSMAEPPPLVAADGVREALGDAPMCGGCGAKLGKGALGDVLTALPHGRDDVETRPGDDAAVLRFGDTRQVVTVDHLRAVTDDPVLMTRIAAIHALGDIWAMGATPQAALPSLILPRMAPALQVRTLREIMETATEVFSSEGAEIVGGHSSMGSEMTLGFTLTGLLERPAITLAGARPGDALILTKPIGSGVILAAKMRGLAKGRWVVGTFEQMTRPQGDAARLLSGAHAMTDVTGFGLAGHLLGICQASGVAAELDLHAIPLMEGAAELARTGVRSTIWAENRALVPALGAGDVADLLYDPQTCGGLLAAVADPDAVLPGLRAAGVEAAVIGRIVEGAPGIRRSGQ